MCPPHFSCFYSISSDLTASSKVNWWEASEGSALPQFILVGWGGCLTFILFLLSLFFYSSFFNHWGLLIVVVQLCLWKKKNCSWPLICVLWSWNNLVKLPLSPFLNTCTLWVHVWIYCTCDLPVQNIHTRGEGRENKWENCRIGKSEEKEWERGKKNTKMSACHETNQWPK